MGPRAGLYRRKTSSSPRFDPGPSSPQSVAIPTELPDIVIIVHEYEKDKVTFYFIINKLIILTFDTIILDTSSDRPLVSVTKIFEYK